MYSLDCKTEFEITETRGTYVYDIQPVNSTVVASLSSDDSLRLFDSATLQLLPDGTIKGASKEATCMRVLEGENAMVCTAGRDGKVKIWDLRAGGESKRMGILEVEDQSAILSLAYSSASHAIATGTELTNYQAVITIWDARNLSKALLTYPEGHSDDITELQYHPTHPTLLLSGSTDGLVNIYDTTIADEEDALHQAINHGSSVHHAGFLNDVDVYALSHDEMFAVYKMITNTDESAAEDPPVVFGDLRKPLRCEYVTDVVKRPDGSAVVGAGSHSNESFDLVQLANSPQWAFAPSEKVNLPEAHGSEIVRAFCFLDNHKVVLTAGEDAKIKAWAS